MGYTPPSGAGATPAQIWAYTPRSLTDKGFWSAIITQVRGTVSIAGGATVNVDVQPPSGETWWVEFLFSEDTYQTGYRQWEEYDDFDGTTARSHGRFDTSNPSAYTCLIAPISVTRVLTNALYARLRAYSAIASTLWYGYGGFKLSKPEWSPERVGQVQKAWRRPLTKPLPSALSGLHKYAFDLYDYEVGDYVAAIMLEENTILAVDPETEFPVERLTAHIDAATLASRLEEFERDPVKTGWKKYFDEWNREGLTF